MKKERKNKSIKIFLIIAVCAALTVSVILAFKHWNRLLPVMSGNASQSSETQTQTPTQVETQTKAETTDATTLKYDKSKPKTIINCPASKEEYTPTPFEAKLFNAINEERAGKGLPALSWNSCLHAKAKIRADETLVSFSHARPDGRKPSTVLTDGKIEFSLFGECLAKGAKENDEGVRLILNGLLMDEKQSETVFGRDYSYAAVSVSTDESGSVHAVILLCNPPENA